MKYSAHKIIFGFEQLDFWIRRMTVCSNEVWMSYVYHTSVQCDVLQQDETLDVKYVTRNVNGLTR